MIRICNMALGYLGEPPITSLDERVPSAEYCKLYLRPMLENVLRDHPWNFAQARERLAGVAMPDGWRGEYAFAYAKPKNCMNLHFLVGKGRERCIHFQLVDAGDRTVVLCNIDRAFAHFTRYIKDSDKYDQLFVQAAARKLQSMLAMALLKTSGQKIQEAEIQYQRALTIARVQDSREGRRFQDETPEWDGGHDLWSDVVRRECGT